ATDYLTKPFGKPELLTVVEQYVGPGASDPPKLDNFLADLLDD
ncbi:MAG: response regulator, partial [Cyanobacteria bacterium J055]